MKKVKWIGVVRTYRCLIICTGLALITMACGRQARQKAETPVSGTISLWADEEVKPLAEAAVQAFEGLYPEGRVHPEFHPEVEILNALLAGGASLAMLTRPLLPSEEAHLHAAGRKVYAVPVAYDAVALLVHPTSSLAVPDLNALGDLLMDSARQDTLVFASKGSASLRLLQDSLPGDQNLPPPSFALGSTSAVLAYVSRHPGAVGFVGLAWLSDGEDPEVIQRKQQLRILKLARRGSEDPCLPLAGTLAQNRYPLRRTVYLLYSGPKAGLAAGFSAFLAGEQGQRIVLKLGLLPYTMPGREVRVE